MKQRKPFNECSTPTSDADPKNWVMRTSINVIGYPWHMSHNFHLCDLPFINTYALVDQPWRQWIHAARPHHSKHILHGNPRAIIRGDLAILHYDQDCSFAPKRTLLEAMASYTRGLPRVVINHGTPVSDKADSDQIRADFHVFLEKSRIPHSCVVVNSQTAAEQWGVGHFIRHAYPSHYFKPLAKAPRVVCYASSGGMNTAYQRDLLNDVEVQLKQAGTDYLRIGRGPSAPKCFADYQALLGHAAVYIHLLKDSPMPRARTEAFLSGCRVVTVGDHGGCDVVQPGWRNVGMHGEATVEQVMTVIEQELESHSLASAHDIRHAALREFNWEEYVRQWSHMATLAINIHEQNL